MKFNKNKPYIDPRYFLFESKEPEYFENTKIIEYFKNLILDLGYPFKFISINDRFKNEGSIYIDFSWNEKIKELPSKEQKEAMKEDIITSLSLNGNQVKEIVHRYNSNRDEFELKGRVSGIYFELFVRDNKMYLEDPTHYYLFILLEFNK